MKFYLISKMPILITFLKWNVDLKIYELVIVFFIWFYHVEIPKKYNILFFIFCIFSAESMFTQNTNSNFQQMIDSVYVETSLRLLDCMHTKYKFMDHLKVYNFFYLILTCFLNQLDTW